MAYLIILINFMCNPWISVLLNCYGYLHTFVYRYSWRNTFLNQVGRMLNFSSTVCINALTFQVPNTIPMPVANPVLTVVRKNFSNVLAFAGENELLSLLILLIVYLFLFFTTLFIWFFKLLKIARICLLIGKYYY